MFMRSYDRGDTVVFDYNSEEVEITVTDKDGKVVAIKLYYEEVKRLALTVETLLLAMSRNA